MIRSIISLFAGCFYLVQLDGAYDLTGHEKQADRLFSEGFYPDAAIYFEEVAVHNQIGSSAYLKLAVSYLEMGESQKALDILKQDGHFKDVSSERLYLMSLAYRQLRQYQAVIDLLPSTPTALLSVEKGIAFYHLKRYSEAENELEQVNRYDDRPYALANLYLIRLAMETDQPDKAKKRLTALNGDLPKNSPYYEKAFLEGLEYYLNQHYAKAAFFFEKALPYENLSQNEWTMPVLTYLADSYLKELRDPDTTVQFSKAEETIQKLLTLDKSERTYLLLVDLYFLEVQKGGGEEAYQKALKAMEHITSSEEKKEALVKQCKIMFGKYHLQQKDWEKADTAFGQLSDDPEALFWRAIGARSKGNEEIAKPYLEQIYIKYPSSPFAPSAYFHYYSYREYIRGQRKAIKHLNAMPFLYGDHSLTISAYYLIGLDNKKNHLSEEGKVVRQKDYIAAIDAFHQAEASYDRLLAKDKISEQDKGYFTQVRYRSILERAGSNYDVANESEGGKKMIYLQYTEDLYRNLIAEFNKPGAPLSLYIIGKEKYPKVLEEAEFGLGRTYLAKNRPVEANRTFDTMLERYQKGDIKQSYTLSRVWSEKGLIAKKNQSEGAALAAFFHAEQAGKDLLSPDEKLDLWIQQSLSYKELDQPNEAMKLLSKVVNDETISNLRVKAMYLRADIYAMQGRKELALKQLIATSGKGGEWGKKAKEKLEQEYE